MKKYALLLLLAAGLLQSCSSSKKSASKTTSAATFSNDDGSSYEKAIVVKAKGETEGVAAEYVWLKKNYPGYTLTRQSLVPKGKKSYDVMSIQTADGDKKDIYFDITDFFGKGLFEN